MVPVERYLVLGCHSVAGTRRGVGTKVATSVATAAAAPERVDGRRIGE